MKGFTLLEIVISVMILAFISVFTAQTIRRSLQDKGKVQRDLDQRSEIRNALKLMERDLNLAFHYRGETAQVAIEIQRLQKLASQTPVPTQAQQQQQQQPGAAAPGFPTTTPPPVPSPTMVPYKTLTQFLGDEKSIYFTSLDNFRTMKDTQKSDQMKVGYYLKECPPVLDNKKAPEGQCLFRRTDDIIDDDITKGGQEVVLLENVLEFKLRYLGPGKEDWSTTWFTNERGDVDTREKFPAAVEITLTTSQNKKQITIATVAELRFPNNADPSKEQNGSNPATTPGTPTRAPNPTPHL